eukprot:TRINITY_DN68836_c0_g1_i1.p1 TRINITY_DN68836_c0_g1~~TRINITY_DN68836_c0_g1_i1.p1  ORF type:complete len:607 (+),score=29.90 TRINITY_DN68836_c0_g1_i1:26-1822(+)
MKYLYNLRFIAVGVLLTILSMSAKAQIPACSTYVFIPYSQTFTYLSGGTVASGIHCDDCVQQNIALNFTFPFCGNNYNTVSVGSNGYISLTNNSSVYLSGSTGAIGSMGPTLFPLWGDEWGTSGATASFLTSGTSPNRVFTFEWRNWRPFSYSSNAEYTMQVRLYETSGKIQFAYKREGSNPLPSVCIGIGFSASDYQSLPLATSSPAPSSTVFTTSITSYPPTDQVYEWNPPTPCPKATVLNIASYNSQGASFNWTGVTGAADYQYAVDTRADLAPNTATTIVTTTTTNGTWTGLTPSTLYYLHVRTRCSPISISQWDTVSFTTRPECSKPGKLLISAVDTNSATFQWPNVITALQYQYIMSTTKLTPTPGASTSVTSSTVAKTGLTEGTWYYVYYRSLCQSTDSSAWALDSFYTPVPCRRPVPTLSNLYSTNAVAAWPSVNTAYEYEYFLNTNTTLPSLGTPIKFPYLQVTALQPKTTYDLFIRCKCRDNGVYSVSPWSILEFVTNPALGVGNVYTAAATVSLYPNPAKDVVTVEITGEYGAGAMLYVTDVTGKVMKMMNVTESKTTVDVKSMSSGIYFVKFVDGGKTSIQRFTKM